MPLNDASAARSGMQRTGSETSAYAGGGRQNEYIGRAGRPTALRGSVALPATIRLSRHVTYPRNRAKRVGFQEGWRERGELMGSPARRRRPARARRDDGRERQLADLEDSVHVAVRLSELQAQITAHQLAIALTIKILAERVREDGKAIELAMYVAAEERVEEHGTDDELAKALKAMHELIGDVLATDR